MSPALAEDRMAKSTSQIRIEDEVLDLVAIAAAYRREKPTVYATRVLKAAAEADISELHDKVVRPKPKGREPKH